MANPSLPSKKTKISDRLGKSETSDRLNFLFSTCARTGLAVRKFCRAVVCYCPKTTDRLNSLLTIRDWVRFAMTEFRQANLYYGHGTDNALDEAVFLILSVLHLPFDMPHHLYKTALTQYERRKVDEIIQKRIHTRKPAPYLTRQAYFMGMSFYVDERVLIPRSPIAELIQKEFQPWLTAISADNNTAQSLKILDLCTGSGCIAIACAEIFPQAQIVAADISPDALAVAEINVKKYTQENTIALIQSDLFEKIPAQKFDLILSNPPYVDEIDSNLKNLPLEYHYEPQIALKAGKDGLKFIKKILAQAKDYLSENGILIVEAGNSAQALIRAFPDLPFTWLEFEHGASEIFLLRAREL